MKKASDILLLIGGIIDIVIGGLFLLCLVPTPFIFSGIFALVARKKQTKGLFITTLVFSILSFEPVTITGAILAIVCDEAGDPLEAKTVEVKETPKKEDDFVSKIKEYKELLDSGAITEEEYNKLKEAELKKKL